VNYNRSFAMPVLMKEMRSRMRGNRMPVLLLVCTALAGLAAVLVLNFMPATLHDPSTPSDSPPAMALLGKILFVILVELEGLICAFIAPALTAGAITLEREQQTLEMLFLTRLSGVNILLGKLLSALSVVVIILLCMLPVQAIAFILGGVAPEQVAWCTLLIFACSTLFAAIGLFFSIHAAKTPVAMALTYSVCLAWLFGVPFLTITMPIRVINMGSHTLNPVYLLGVLLFTAIVTLAPICFICLLTSLCIRRSVSRLFFFLLWALAIVCCLVLNMSVPITVRSLFNGNSECLLLGNPMMAIVFEMLAPPYVLSRNWVYGHFVPITCGLLISGTIMMLAYAALEFTRQRRLVPARRARKAEQCTPC